MDTFYETLVRWQPFFTAIAGVSATLAGLLFVSLSINRERITAAENHILLRLARRSFGDFMYALFIAIVILMPGSQPRMVALPLMFIALFRAWRMVVAFREFMKADWNTPDRKRFLFNFCFQIATSVALFLTAYELDQGKWAAMYCLVPIACFLLYNASSTAWQLLLLEKRIDSGVEK